MRRPFPLWSFVVLTATGPVASCDQSVAPTEMDTPSASADATPESAAAVASDASLLPPGIADLPIEPLLRMKLVPFPASDQVGVCHTQVAVPTRPLPFRVHRLRVGLPSTAWTDARGRTAVLEYQRLGANGFVMRLARCRIPDSAIAADALFERFSLPPDRAGDTPATRPNLVEVRRWGPDRGALQPQVGSEAGVPAGTEPGAGDPGSETHDDRWIVPVSPDGTGTIRGFIVSTDESCEFEWDGNSPTATCCSNPNHIIVSPGECGCENGSSEPDCSEDGGDAGDPPPPPPPDCEFEPCYGGGGDPPGDDDGDGCDPTEFTCEPAPPGDALSLSSDAPADLSLHPPDCEADDLDPREETWCSANEPDVSQMTLLESVFDEIEHRCPFLSQAWSSVNQNIRVWTWTDEPFGGAAAVGGDWMLLSTQWLDHDAELALTHELLHIAGHSHDDDQALQSFIDLERQCSGGRSAFDWP